MKTYKETEYLIFTEIKDTGKTKQLAVGNKKGEWLGSISWYGPWRRYTYSPLTSSTYDVNCLNDITSVINELMDVRKKIS